MGTYVTEDRGSKISCCGLGQISAPDNATVKQFEELFALLKRDANGWLAPNREGYIKPVDEKERVSNGQQCFFCIATDNEPNLKKVLVEVGFTEGHKFRGKLCYPQDYWLTMYCINI